MASFKKCGKAIIDQGALLGKGAYVDKKDVAKNQAQVTGYTIMQTKELDAAIQGSPIIRTL